MSYDPYYIYTQKDVESFTQNNTINKDVTIRGEQLETLIGVEKIVGFLTINDSSIESLGDLQEITGNFFISSYNIFSRLKSLGNLKTVEGDLSLRYSNVEDLGELRKVGGKLSLRDSKITNLGKLNFVGGDLFLPLKLKDNFYLSNINVLGKVLYWNDNKIIKNIIPKEQLGFTIYNEPIPFLSEYDSLNFEVFKKANLDQREFYKIFKQNFINGKFIDLKDNYRYSAMLYFDLMEEYSKVKNINNFQVHFTNLNTYYPKIGNLDGFIIQELELIEDYVNAWKIIHNQNHISYSTIMVYEERLNRPLLDGELLIKLIGYSHLTPFGQKNIEKIKPFVTKQITILEEEKGIKFYDIYVNNTVDNQLFILFRQAEDLYRESIGMPKIGKGWISETELFNCIKEAFFEDEVISQGRPDWLGLQRFDIYFPKYNIAIEYQGQQHFQEVSLFGGKEGLIKVQENDRKKRYLCAINNCYLIEVLPDYDIEELLSQIKSIIQIRG